MEATSRELVVEVVREHAESLLRVARRYSACAADAEDAYQRALEIFVKNAHRLDADGAHKWLHVVVRNEALAVRRSRSALVGVEDEAVLDALDDARHVASVEERSERFDDLARAAEALQRLKPQEVTALWLKAEGLSYQEIAERQGWTYTKVNRCITEGRRAFLSRYAGIDAGEECARWEPMLSALADGEATPQQLLEVRPHLRNCPACRASLAAMQRGGAAAAALLPAPVAAGGLVARLVEWVAAAGQTLAVGKAAAVAASAAAIAGGGIAVERHVGEDAAGAASGPPVPAVTRTTPQPPVAPAPERIEPSGAAGRGLAVANGPGEPGPRAPRRSGDPPTEAAFALEAESTAGGEGGPEQSRAASAGTEADAAGSGAGAAASDARAAAGDAAGAASEERRESGGAGPSGSGRSTDDSAAEPGGEFGLVAAP